MDVWIERDNVVIDVRDAETEQNSVFSINDIDTFNDFVDDGFMCNSEDSNGMEEYLLTVGIFTKDDQIVAVT